VSTRRPSNRTARARPPDRYAFVDSLIESCDLGREGGLSVAADVPTRKRTEGLRGWANAGFIFGLVGMLTGTLSLFLSWRVSQEEAAVALQAYPTANPTDLTHEGFGLRVEIVNRSLRPVIVRGASLWAGGEKLSEATGYLEDVTVLDESAANPQSVTQRRRHFPITVNAREGRTFALLMDVWTPILAAPTTSREQAARRRLNQFLTRVASPESSRDEDIELRLEHVPGGSGTFVVRRLRPPETYQEAIRSASSVQKQLSSNFWVVTPHVQGERFVGLVLRRRFSGAGQVDLVRLDVWKDGSPYYRSLIRPVVAQQSTLFPLPRLPAGSYRATFRLGDDVVAYESFVLPWQHRSCDRRRTIDVTAATDAPDWCEKGRSR
jgi:hypothetical protein